eukprot:gene13200-19035_t
MQVLGALPPDGDVRDHTKLISDPIQTLTQFFQFLPQVLGALPPDGDVREHTKLISDRIAAACPVLDTAPAIHPVHSTMSLNAGESVAAGVSNSEGEGQEDNETAGVPNPEGERQEGTDTARPVAAGAETSTPVISLNAGESAAAGVPHAEGEGQEGTEASGPVAAGVETWTPVVSEADPNEIEV